ncbi:hypothetical protein Tco_1545780, partial [Tanacetum coccineum]
GGDGWEMMVCGRGGVAVEGSDEVEMVGDGVAVVGGVGGSEMVVPWWGWRLFGGGDVVGGLVVWR